MQQARDRREQEHAPPAALPARTWCLYTDGSFYKEKKEDPGSAGYGVSVVLGGDGDTDQDGHEAYALCGPLRTGRDEVEKLSNNTAELRGVIEALRYARLWAAPAAVIRYDSKYAAMITTNVWRARKNKKLAAVAREEWQHTWKALKGKLWLKHVRGHSNQQWNDRADALAEEGRSGRLRPAPPRGVV